MKGGLFLQPVFLLIIDGIVCVAVCLAVGVCVSLCSLLLSQVSAQCVHSGQTLPTLIR